ncbi:MAG: hypothetical protein V7784_15275, partial [Oceanospirillaceae bacterium]
RAREYSSLLDRKLLMGDPGVFIWELYAFMNKIERVLTSMSLIFSLIFIVVTLLEVQASLDGIETIMTLEQYNIFWWVSLSLTLFGAALCLKDVHQRFSSANERSKWYLLFLIFGSFSYPYYFFKYAIKPRL